MCHISAAAQTTPPPPAPQPHRSMSLDPLHASSDSVEAAIKDIRLALQRTKTLPLRTSPGAVESLELTDSPIWVPRWVHCSLCHLMESVDCLICIFHLVLRNLLYWLHDTSLLQETNRPINQWGAGGYCRATQTSQWWGWRWGRWAGTSLCALPANGTYVTLVIMYHIIRISSRIWVVSVVCVIDIIRV
jgi:hypothetical protein